MTSAATKNIWSSTSGLQQLKDKVMASLEGMLQRGEIGAPGGGAGAGAGAGGAGAGGVGAGAGAYEMPDTVELTLLAWVRG